ncbi:putative phosphodiesterase [Actimicrobium sp. GrIS 1.19]|uniref:metallophosphoesterase family protein n=1 Tax=Actimicrobium sp. GrIS 1.19 TaxID=3071708 RepID=UPI002E087B74|nr:putative phosphodiesterase [Actimicrobium sp. GrIS 1.19]
MKLQIVSDLHLEFFKDPMFTGIIPAADADALVIAGDIAVRTNAIAPFRDWPVPVLYIHGNHELYSGHDYGKTVTELRELCAGTQIHFMEQDQVILDCFPRVRFLGSCMWTDYLLFGRERQSLSMKACREGLADHSRIRSQGRTFNPKDAMFRHVKAKAWMLDRLDEPFDGSTVVVTHHGCSMKSVGPRWRRDPVCAGFCSDLDTLVAKSDLWIHGHTHESFDYQIGDARVIVNPRGYPTANGYENGDFDSQLVVEIGE